MAGRAVSRARFEAEQLRIAEARALPTEPRDEPASYSPALLPEVIELAKCGLAQAEIAAHWAISEETLKAWEEAHIEFKAASQRARTTSKAWWQRQPRIAIAEGNNKFPAGAWAQQVRALFPEYDDKTSVHVHLDLGSLVRVNLSVPAPGLPDQQMVSEAKPLIEGEYVVLPASQTASEPPSDEPQPDAPASSSDGGGSPDPAGGGGVPRKP